MSVPLSHPPGSESNARTLVLCFDGSSNEFDTTNTNVVKFFSFLEKEDWTTQMVYYQTGVGTYTNPVLVGPVAKSIANTVDLATAWYLDAHVMGGYRFLMQNFQKNDKICLFGFSRGAYTARVLAGMLYAVGLLPPSMHEQVPFAYRMFKKNSPKTRHLCADYKHTFSRAVTIEFIGVWDTVASVGSIFPRNLPFTVNNRITKTFRHALALDEHRAKFRNNCWHRQTDDFLVAEKQVVAKMIDGVGKIPEMVMNRLSGFTADSGEDEAYLDDNGDPLECEVKSPVDMIGPPTDVKEVWFSGSHGDVGGGNVDDHVEHSLARIPLRWMIKECFLTNTGIRFKYDELDRAHIPHPKPTHTYLSGDLTNDGQVRINSTVAASDTMRTMSSAQTAVVMEEVAPFPQSTDASPSSSKFPDHEAATSSEAPPSHLSVSVNASQQREALKPKEHNLLTPKADRRDVVTPIHDSLKSQPFWWLLEILPFATPYQDEDDIWHTKIRFNLFRGRDIPKPPRAGNPNSSLTNSAQGVNIPPAALFHSSVKVRMDSPDTCKGNWKSLWRKKNIPYRPRAWPADGKVEFVD